MRTRIGTLVVSNITSTWGASVPNHISARMLSRQTNKESPTLPFPKNLRDKSVGGGRARRRHSTLYAAQVRQHCFDIAAPCVCRGCNIATCHVAHRWTLATSTGWATSKSEMAWARTVYWGTTVGQTSRQQRRIITTVMPTNKRGWAMVMAATA